MGEDSGEALVDEPHRHRRDHASERFGKVSCLVSGLSSISGKACGESDHNLGHIAGSGKPRNLGEITAATAHRSQRAGQQAARVGQ